MFFFVGLTVLKSIVGYWLFPIIKIVVVNILFLKVGAADPSSRGHTTYRGLRRRNQNINIYHAVDKFLACTNHNSEA